MPLVLIHIYPRRVYTVNAPTIHMHGATTESRAFELASRKRASGTLKLGEVRVASFFFRWPISRLECKETAKEKGEMARMRAGRTDSDINDRFKNLFTTKLLLTRENIVSRDRN